LVYTWLPQAVVKGIALGDIDPLTKELFEVLVCFCPVLVRFLSFTRKTFVSLTKEPFEVLIRFLLCSSSQISFFHKKNFCVDAHFVKVMLAFPHALLIGQVGLLVLCSFKRNPFYSAEEPRACNDMHMHKHSAAPLHEEKQIPFPHVFLFVSNFLTSLIKEVLSIALVHYTSPV
jgi:hypothetical protein